VSSPPMMLRNATSSSMSRTCRPTWPILNPVMATSRSGARRGLSTAEDSPSVAECELFAGRHGGALQPPVQPLAEHENVLRTHIDDDHAEYVERNNGRHADLQRLGDNGRCGQAAGGGRGGQGGGRQD